MFSIFAWLLVSIDNREVFITSQPVSQDKGAHGIYKLARWTEKSGIATKSLTNSYQELASSAETFNPGNLIYISLPSALPANQAELIQLRQWIEIGNTAILMLALDDKPHWHNQLNEFTVEKVLSSLDLKLEQLVKQESVSASNTDNGKLITRLPVNLTQNVNIVQSNSAPMLHTWQLLGQKTPISALILLRDAATQSPVTWLSHLGKGKIITSTHSDIFSNAQLGKADNLTLFRNILNVTVKTNGTVYFDDVHHIVPPAAGTTIFVLVPLCILIGLVFLYSYVKKLTNRSRSPNKARSISLQQSIQNISIEDARTSPTHRIAIRYAQHCFRAIRRHHGLCGSKPAWSLLKKHSGNKRLLYRLKKTYERANAAKHVNLNRFIERLNKLRY
jgi:hypothetical protein